MQVAAALRGLVLEATEGHELTLAIEHTLYRRRAEGSDQLILEVGIARIEAVVLGAGTHCHAGARGHARTLEATPHVPQLGNVAQPGQPHTQAARTQRLYEALHVRGPADRHDDDAFGQQVAAAPPRQRFERRLVAPALDQDRRTRLRGAHQTTRGVGVERWARAPGAWRR